MTEIPTLDQRLVEMAGRLREYTGALSAVDLAEAGPVAAAATMLDLVATMVGAPDPAPADAGWPEVIHTRERQLAMVLGLSAGASWGELLDLVGEQRAYRSMAAVDQAPSREPSSGITSVILAPGSLRLRLCQALGVQPGGGELDATLAGAVEDLAQERRDLIDDLQAERRSTLMATSQLEALQRQLVDVLGLAPVTDQVTDQDIVGNIVGNVRALVQRLAANTRQQDAHRRSAVDSAMLRETLVEQLKLLATYAPGHDEMDADQLRTEVNTVLANTLGELHAAVKASDALRNDRDALHLALSLPPGAGADQAMRAVRDLHARFRDARARIHQARMLHVDDAHYCSTCHGEGGQVIAWPCDTVLALSGRDRLQRDGDALPGDELSWLDPDGAHAAATEAERARDDELDDDRRTGW